MQLGMLLFIVRRILALGLLLVLMSIAIFSLLHIAPGDPVDILIGRNPRDPQLVQALREKYQLDEPFLTQYWIWAKNAIKFEFGNSIQTSLPVTDEIKTRLPTSLFLGLYAFVVTMAFGILFGLVAALKRQSPIDRGIVSTAVVGLSTPAFVAGVLFLYVFGVILGWFPVFGRGGGFFDQLWHLTLPAFAMALSLSAWVIKHTRASVIGVLDQDYVTFARARGLSRSRVLLLYVLRNGLIPVVTIAGLLLAGLIVGAVFVEVVFSLPGVGGLLVESAINKDVPMLQGVALLIGTIIIVANLLADLAYVVLDPRIRLGRGAT